MSGTLEGGKKASLTNKQLHGEDYYSRIALLAQKQWDKNGRKPRGFAAKVQCACKLVTGQHYYQQCAGKRGGAISRRTR